MVKVSIIIPVYNVEMYLVECLDSVLRQTLKNIEIICINDGSTDESLEVLKNYAEKDSRIRIVDKENEGYGVGMNIGLEMATGEYIGIVEPDDYIPLNMYEDLYNKATEYNLDFVKADFYRFKRDEKGNMELIYNHLSKNADDYNVVFNPSQTPETLRFIMNTWSGIYRRSFLNTYNIRHNTTPGASFQDNGFYFQTFVYAKRAMIIDKPYYMNRRDNPNSSVHSKEKVYCINNEYDFIRTIIEKDPEIWGRFKGMYWVKKYTNYKGTINRIGEEYKEEYIKRFSDEFNKAEIDQELNQEMFKQKEWETLNYIMKDPAGYYQKKVAPGSKNKSVTEVERIKKLETEIKNIRNSKTYKVGKMITAIPRKLINVIKN